MPPPGAPSAAGCPALTPAASTAIGTTLGAYFDNLNAQNYAGAFATLTPAGQARVESLATFADENSTSFDSDIRFGPQQVQPDCRVSAEVAFASTQAPAKAPNGVDTCDDWDLDYLMVHNPNGTWSIDIALPADGGAGYTAC